MRDASKVQAIGAVIARLFLLAEEVVAADGGSFTANLVRESARSLRGGGQRAVAGAVELLSGLVTDLGTAPAFEGLRVILRRGVVLVRSLVEPEMVFAPIRRAERDDNSMVLRGETWPNYYPTRNR